MGKCDKYSQIIKQSCTGLSIKKSHWQEIHPPQNGGKALNEVRTLINSLYGQKWGNTCKLDWARGEAPPGVRKLKDYPPQETDPIDDCCGPGKGRHAWKESETPVGTEIRRPLHSQGPDRPTLPVQYKVSYKRLDTSALEQAYREARAELIDSMDRDWILDNICRAGTDSDRNRCVMAEQKRLQNRIDDLTAEFNNAKSSGDWNGLAAKLKLPAPVEKDGFQMKTYHEKVDEWEQEQSYDTNWVTNWICGKDDPEPCCECDGPDDCDCETNLCDDINDCDPNTQECKGMPDCPNISPKGCCEDNCASICGPGLGSCGPGQICKGGCCWDDDCRYGLWSPNPLLVCDGEVFTQEAMLVVGSLETCELKKYRTNIGSKLCSTTSSTMMNTLLEDYISKFD